MTSKVPVPDLEGSCQRYLKSLEPLLNPAQLSDTRNRVKEFVKSGGIGWELQEKLQQRALQRESWLSEWWDNYAYFDNPEPIAIDYSPGFVIEDDHVAITQITRAARLIRGVLDFKTTYESGNLKPDTLRGAPLCMDQYTRLLAHCRFPHPKRDYTISYPLKEARHVAVLYRGEIFTFDAVTPEGRTLTEAELQVQIRRIVNHAAPVTNPPVGVFTTEDRTVWYNVREKLLTAGDSNRHVFDAIERSIILVCLDSENPRRSKERLLQVLCGPVAAEAGNRYYDKSLQLIISADGQSSLNIEHGSFDGPPPARIVSDYLVPTLNKPLPQTLEKHQEDQMPLPRKHSWVLYGGIERDIQAATRKIHAAIDHCDMEYVEMDTYGATLIKRAKMSPDAYVQMAIQLAYYRLHGKPGLTYESASLRKYRLGRTEVCRSLTCDALEFCKVMCNPLLPAQEKAVTIRNATRAQSAYMQDAVAGRGCDRHLLGLRMIAKEAGIEMPAIFEDPAYKHEWTLSTSQVSFPGTTVSSFGPVSQKGYGVCYNINPDRIIFSISSRGQTVESNSKQLASALHKALTDMAAVLRMPSKL
eukprot:GFYU01004608.1.p1 GENE.GFYU01004608.1~~GFYU01004608.1.p1  ORF type:complete len:585 (+),score=155.56 GFYU01004608.1:123-1877(+)